MGSVVLYCLFSPLLIIIVDINLEAGLDNLEMEEHIF